MKREKAVNIVIVLLLISIVLSILNLFKQVCIVSLIKKHLDSYRIAKDNNITQPIMTREINKDLDNLSFKHLKAISTSLGKDIVTCRKRIKYFCKTELLKNNRTFFCFVYF